jgi:flagellar FliL protein
MAFCEAESAFIKEDEVAEENAAKEQAAAPAAAPSKAPVLLIALAVLNMAVVGGVGYMLWAGRKNEAAEPKLEHVIRGEAKAQAEEAGATPQPAAIVPLETFIVNLSGSKGRRIAKVSMELEMSGEGAAAEIDQRKAQIRDIIIILLSGKTYDEVAAREGKEKLRDEIRDTVNAFLNRGRIQNVYFTEFIYN